MEISPGQVEAVDADSAPVFELRVYHAAEGKLEDLIKRFRDHTIGLFLKHDLKPVAFWVATDEPLSNNTLIYILEHPSRENAKANWAAFSADPDWTAVKAASEANGKLVDKIDSTYMSKLEIFAGRL
jgi:hypothetical protein